MPFIHAPTAPRLCHLAAADWPADPAAARAMVAELIDFLGDPKPANRDWATFLLAQSPEDCPALRDALLAAAADSNLLVRGEALLGLARRDRVSALPHVQAALALDRVSVALLEAAALCAHPSLIPDLEYWSRPSANRMADMAATEALLACRLASARPAPGAAPRPRFG
ncbi:lyase, partial [Sandarakinorhabdus rubra]|uniref:lyase n=1 Tax=Sandarakinorhabdus rubra TaxID=2672568 RepID=UPI0013DC8E6A